MPTTAETWVRRPSRHDERLSGRVVSPSWLDETSVVFADAVPALVTADIGTGELDRVQLYDADSEVFPG